MTTLAQVRVALVDLVSAVDGAGIVHPCEPYAKTNAAFQALYGWDDGEGNTQLRGCFWRVVRIQEQTLSLGRVLNIFTWRLKRFMALNTGGSELEFDDVTESIRAAYRLNETLGDLVQPGPLGETTGFQLVDSTPVMFAGVLCHSATLQLTTYAYLNSGE